MAALLPGIAIFLIYALITNAVYTILLSPSGFGSVTFNLSIILFILGIIRDVSVLTTLGAGLHFIYTMESDNGSLVRSFSIVSWSYAPNIIVSIFIYLLREDVLVETLTSASLSGGDILSLFLYLRIPKDLTSILLVTTGILWTVYIITMGTKEMYGVSNMINFFVGAIIGGLLFLFNIGLLFI